jgi:hypothetical protein
MKTNGPVRGAMAGSFEKLRDEILEYRKSQSEFIRWKLLAIGSAAVIGLGLGEKGSGDAPILVLCVIPFMVVYSDLILAQYELRIAAIAWFLRRKDQVYGEYEKYLEWADIAKSYWYVMEGAAIVISSLLSCGALIVVGKHLKLFTTVTDTAMLCDKENALIWAGLLGIGASLLVYILYGALWFKLKHAATKKASER